MLCSNIEIANLLGTSPQAICNAVRRGKLVKEANGLINSENAHNKKYIGHPKAQRKRGPDIAAKNARKKAQAAAATRQVALDALDPPWPEYVAERGEYYAIEQLLSAVIEAWKFEADYLAAAAALWDLSGDADDIAGKLAELFRNSAFNGDLIMSEAIWEDGDPTHEAPGPGLIHIEDLTELDAADPHRAAREKFESDMLATLPGWLASMPDPDKRSQSVHARFKIALALIPSPLAHDPRP